MSFLLPTLIATLALASPLSTTMTTKQALEAVPLGWELEAAAPPQMTIAMHIGLKESNLDKLEQRMLEISDPDHPNYGKHMSKADVDALTAPSKDTIDAVTKWLMSHGIPIGEIKGGSLKITLPISKAEEMLDTSYGVYHDVARARYTVRTTKYSVPEYVHEHISMIHPTTLFTDFSKGSAKKMMATTKISSISPSSSGNSACSGGHSEPACIRENYNINGYIPTNKTTIGILGFLGDDPDKDDLSLFLQRFTNFPKDSSYTVFSINGGVNVNTGTNEANLDVQTIKGLTHPINTIYYSTANSPPFIPDEGTPKNTNEPYLDWLQFMSGLNTPPQTISISYGDDEQTVPKDYADNVCTQFMKLGARGVSILVSSGDEGTTGKDYTCTSNDGTKTHEFIPQFPGTCPWVTTVGGTRHYGTNESAESLGGSGFSNYYSRPNYQSDAVNQYIKSIGNSFKGLYNTTGRAYPDISAAFSDFPVFKHGHLSKLDGTSASCPAVASIIALLNDYLVSNGKAPLGFLNPFLYKKGLSGIRDITTGSSIGCIWQDAFPAGHGWDSPTGLGVPNFGKLKDLV